MRPGTDALVASLFDGPLDIVGDVHGEYLALRQLLRHLGYDSNGEHPSGRRLVFVGDLCDRGPDSPAVIALVRSWVERGLAQCVLGNHELNVLRQERKPGNGWAFDEHPDHARPLFADRRRATAREREDFRRFFAQLPLALERGDLRITHAAWHGPAVDALRDRAAGDTLGDYRRFEADVQRQIPPELQNAAEDEKRRHAAQWHDSAAVMPMLENLARRNEIYQLANPLRVLTSGLEQRAERAFFAGGKWRMVRRLPWWNDYRERHVIVGHYWRWWNAEGLRRYSRGEPDLFAPARPVDWLGPARSVFCVDFSIGARYREIADGLEPGSVTRLGAVRWPENELLFDNGERHALRA